jgi:hypothetical protein
MRSKFNDPIAEGIVSSNELLEISSCVKAERDENLRAIVPSKLFLFNLTVCSKLSLNRVWGIVPEKQLPLQSIARKEVPSLGGIVPLKKLS